MLASEITRNALVRSIMFWTFWLINATATFIFGFEFVGVVFAGLFATLPISLPAALTLANFTGGIAALAVLDLAYKGWQFQEMNTAETMTQVWIARAMAWLSFLISSSYSAIVLALGMPLLGLTGEQTAWIHLYGGFTFIFITILHLFAATVYQQAGIAHRERATIVNMTANKETERLDFQERIHRQALLETRQVVQEEVGSLATAYRQLWAQDLIEANKPKELPAQPQILEHQPKPPTPLAPSTTEEPPMTSTAANFRPSDNLPTPMVIFPTPSTNGYHSPTSNGSSRHEGF